MCMWCTYTARNEAELASAELTSALLARRMLGGGPMTIPVEDTAESVDCEDTPLRQGPVNWEAHWQHATQRDEEHGKDEKDENPPEMMWI